MAKVEINTSYTEGIELLADAWGTTFDGVVNGLIYRGLIETLTPEVIETGLAKQREGIERRLRIGPYARETTDG